MHDTGWQKVLGNISLILVSCYRLNSLYYLSVNVLCVWPSPVIFPCCDLCMSSWAQGPSEIDLYIVCS